MKLNLVTILAAALLTTLSIGFIPHSVQAEISYFATDLTTKDLDQINKIVITKIKESRKSKGDKTIPLKEAILIIFSRPNSDGMIEKVLSPLRAELDSLDTWEKVIKELVKEALESIKDSMKNSKNFKSKVQVTYLVLLDNFISEILKPAAEGGFERSLLNEIKDAHLIITKEIQKERTFYLMKPSPSPSKTAEMILQEKQKN